MRRWILAAVAVLLFALAALHAGGVDIGPLYQPWEPYAGAGLGFGLLLLPLVL